MLNPPEHFTPHFNANTHFYPVVLLAQGGKMKSSLGSVPRTPAQCFCWPPSTPLGVIKVSQEQQEQELPLGRGIAVSQQM